MLSHLWCYRSKLVVAEEVYFSLVRLTAEMQGLISVYSKTQDTKEKHSHRSEEKSVELTNHCWRSELKK